LNIPTLTKLRSVFLTTAVFQWVKLLNNSTSVCRAVLLKRENKLGSKDVRSHMNHPCTLQAKSGANMRQEKQIKFMVLVAYILKA
jgi:hypothetical protein